MADDSAVVSAIRGDRAAFDTLVRRSARLVYARLYLDTGDRHRAEDLAQETFVRAWRAVGNLKSAGAWNDWLLTIARAVLLDDHKHSKRHKRAALRTTTTDPAALIAPQPGAGHVAELAEEKARLIAALRDLPEPQRSVLALRYLAGVESNALLAQQLALSEGAVRGLLHRGLILLRERLSTPDTPPAQATASSPPLPEAGIQRATTALSL